MSVVKPESVGLDELLPRLRCPRTKLPLMRDGASLRSEDGRFVYPIVDGVPDLRVAPERHRVDVPWYEPWQDLETLVLEPPAPIDDGVTPGHLDRYLAGAAGAAGAGRFLLEVGCAGRDTEHWFASHGFRYVGIDVDQRGVGPHVLGDAHNLPLADASFDLYLSLAVYEHLAAPLVAAREAIRVLRPGGLFFGSAAFVYGFHDRASFHHMSHAGLLFTLRSAGFEVERIWPDWAYTQSIAELGFRGTRGWPWRAATGAFLSAMEWSFTRTSSALRRALGRRSLDLPMRRVETAGSLSFLARKPGT